MKTQTRGTDMTTQNLIQELEIQAAQFQSIGSSRQYDIYNLIDLIRDGLFDAAFQFARDMRLWSCVDLIDQYRFQRI